MRTCPQWSRSTASGKSSKKGLRETKQMLVEKRGRRDPATGARGRPAPHRAQDDRRIRVEALAAAGGTPTTIRTSFSKSAPEPRDEAALFCRRTFPHVSRYANRRSGAVEVLESSPSSLGGVKDIVAAIQGGQSLFQAEIRERRPPRAARSGHRAAGPHPYVGGNRCRAARGRRNRHQNRS